MQNIKTNNGYIKSMYLPNKQMQFTEDKSQALKFQDTIPEETKINIFLYLLDTYDNCEFKVEKAGD